MHAGIREKRQERCEEEEGYSEVGSFRAGGRHVEEFQGLLVQSTWSGSGEEGCREQGEKRVCAQVGASIKSLSEVR